jgi:hypothetical protein
MAPPFNASTVAGDLGRVPRDPLASMFDFRMVARAVVARHSALSHEVAADEQIVEPHLVVLDPRALHADAGRESVPVASCQRGLDHVAGGAHTLERARISSTRSRSRATDDVVENERRPCRTTVISKRGCRRRR